MAKIYIIKCPICKREVNKDASAYHRAKKYDLNMYCGRECAGIARRTNKSIIQKKKEKREYDKKYRSLNKGKRRKQNSEWFQRTYDPVAAAIKRKENMHRHIEYCRQPKYKAKKKIYDRKRRAINQFGSFWESHIALLDLDNAIKEMASKYEISIQNQTYNKKQKRRREYENLNSNKS